MRRTKAIHEDIDELHANAKQAREIYDRCLREQRDMTDAEARLFDTLAPLAHKDRLAELQAELKTAIDRDNQIKAAATRDSNGRTKAMNLVLPINGILPGDMPTAPMANVRTKQLKAFKDERTALLAGHWLRAFVSEEFYGRRDEQAADFCAKNGILTIRNAGVEGSGPAGGYVVPAPLAQTIIDVREQVGVARQLCHILPMTSDTLSVPKRVGGLTVYGGSENPAADMTASDKTWKQIELLAKKRYVVHQISQELVDDALIAIVDDAVTEMAYALADAEDAEFIAGDGTSTYRGVFGLLAKIGTAGVYTNSGEDHDAWDEFDLQDFADTIAKLPSRFARDTAWLCSSEFYHSVMFRLAVAAGGNTFSTVLREGADGRPTFLARPVYFSRHMPTSTATSQKACLFGTFSMAALMGDRTGGPRMARSDDFAFLRDLVTLKATSRYDIEVHEPGDATNAGAYVALATNS